MSVFCLNTNQIILYQNRTLLQSFHLSKPGMNVSKDILERGLSDADPLPPPETGRTVAV